MQLIPPLPGIPNPLGALAGALGTAVLQRTYFLEVDTPIGIPRLLIVLDAVTEEEPEFTADVTENPVEDGNEVTDHIQLKAPTLRLRGTISNTPVDLSTSIGNAIAGGIDLITSGQARSNFLNAGLQQAASIGGAALMGGASATTGAALAGAADAIARTAFLDCYNRRARFDVVTKRQRYEGMVIETLRFPRDQSTGYQLAFEVELKKIRIVKSLTVQVASVAESVLNSAVGALGLGQQSPVAAAAGVAAAPRL
jgi:hypothetical protein